MLDAGLTDAAAFSSLQARWREAGTLRVGPVLRPGAADALLSALRAQPFELRAGAWPALRFQLWQHTFRPEDGCDHVLCTFGRFVHEGFAAWASRLTGLALAPPDDRLVAATRYTKGCYLDTHNDADGRRAVAYVFGLTREAWDPTDGGHLEFLGLPCAQGGPFALETVERRPPGWNTLDLFDVRGPDRPHRIPLVRAHHDRWAVSGWLYREAPDDSP